MPWGYQHSFVSFYFSVLSLCLPVSASLSLSHTHTLLMVQFNKTEMDMWLDI